jgi:NO-binding membrane sensor protein with MHYT domain
MMHFIAMLGFSVPGTSVRYNIPLTVASMAMAMAVVGVGLFIVVYGAGATGPLLAGGLLTGVGVAAMHYTGMAAMRGPYAPHYSLPLVAVSVVIAVIAGIAALWAALRLNAGWHILVASLIMGVAVTGMHYTGMAALYVRACGGALDPPWSASVDGFLLPLIFGIGAVLFVFMAWIVLSPTAAEIAEENRLMERIGQAQDRLAR